MSGIIARALLCSSLRALTLSVCACVLLVPISSGGEAGRGLRGYGKTLLLFYMDCVFNKWRSCVNPVSAPPKALCPHLFDGLVLSRRETPKFSSCKARRRPSELFGQVTTVSGIVSGRSDATSLTCVNGTIEGTFISYDIGWSLELVAKQMSQADHRPPLILLHFIL